MQRHIQNAHWSDITSKCQKIQNQTEVSKSENTGKKSIIFQFFGRQKSEFRPLCDMEQDSTQLSLTRLRVKLAAVLSSSVELIPAMIDLIFSSLNRKPKFLVQKTVSHNSTLG